MNSHVVVPPIDDRVCVSVIVRTKDRPALLEEALSSLANQTYSEIELVVVNDGGTDVQSLIDDYRSVFSKIVYVNLKDNVGRARASAVGLQNVSGDYIMFLDDDDLYDPDHIEGLLNAVVSDKEVRVAYSGVRAEVDGQEIYFNKPFSPEMLRFQNSIPIHSYIFHRSLLDDGVHIDEHMVIYDDWDFILQLCEHTRFKHLDRVSATYRTGGDSDWGGLTPDHASVMKGVDLLWAKWCNKWSGKQIKETFIEIIEGHMMFSSMIKDKDKQISNLTSRLPVDENEGGCAVGRLAELENSNAYQARCLTELEEGNQKLMQELKQSVDNYRNLSSSTCWRITWPLRKCISFFRGYV